jgi:hypothetical protein
MKRDLHSSSVIPVGGEVYNVVFWDLFLYPLQQVASSRLSFFDVDLVSKNDGPDQTENELQLAINNI